jgi:hypothetical protein
VGIDVFVDAHARCKSAFGKYRVGIGFADTHPTLLTLNPI